MKCKYLAILALFLGSLSLVGDVVVDQPTLVELVKKLYQKAQALQNEFPELAIPNRCEEFQKYIERGKPVRPFGQANPEGDKAWAFAREKLNLLCNFEVMWTKIKAALKNPNTTGEAYISSLRATLSTWETAWRSLHNEVKIR
jgi:hypothetical protein